MRLKLHPHCLSSFSTLEHTIRVTACWHLNKTDNQQFLGDRCENTDTVIGHTNSRDSNCEESVDVENSLSSIVLDVWVIAFNTNNIHTKSKVRHGSIRGSANYY